VPGKKHPFLLRNLCSCGELFSLDHCTIADCVDALCGVDAEIVVGQKAEIVVFRERQSTSKSERRWLRGLTAVTLNRRVSISLRRLNAENPDPRTTTFGFSILKSEHGMVESVCFYQLNKISYPKVDFITLILYHRTSRSCTGKTEEAMQVTRVASIDSADLRPYRTLRRPVDHQRRGIFVAEGEKVVRRLLESELEIISVLLTPEWLAVYRHLLETKGEGLNVFVADKKLVESIVGFRLHQGIMAVAKIPKASTLDGVLAGTTRPHLFVAIDGLTNAENLGVLVRN